MTFFGYLCNEKGEHYAPTVLEDAAALTEFIQNNLDVPQLMITDAADKQLLLIKDGVDLHNELEKWGIKLGEIFQAYRQSLQDHNNTTGEKPEWERYYDSIGLSAGEIRMRQRVKKACKKAQTIADVADLLKGTYFNIRLRTKTDGRVWRYFDFSDHSVELVSDDADDEIQKAFLALDARVAYISSSEDIHEFYLLDPP